MSATLLLPDPWAETSVLSAASRSTFRAAAIAKGFGSFEVPLTTTTTRSPPEGVKLRGGIAQLTRRNGRPMVAIANPSGRPRRAFPPGDRNRRTMGK
jgi:hypothetical protein